VIEAVKKSGKALKYCLNILQNNYYIIFAAIKTQDFAYQIGIPFKYR
jgi:hypothetical protein